MSIVQRPFINNAMAQEKEQVPQLDINAIRKANLRRLIAQAGTLAAFSEKADVNADYLSSILAEGAKRNAGDSLMRRIEVKLDLPYGSLDFPEQESMLYGMAVDALPDNAKQQVMDFIRYKVETTDVLTARERAASYLKMIDNLKRDMARRKKKG